MDLSMNTATVGDRTEKVSLRSTEYRKVIKPLLERRRRARINSCLDELKALILETTENENADASKLEKADILELTVQHLKNFRHRQQQRTNVSEDKFRTGFAECAHQVSVFLTGEDHMTKSRLISHLANCIDRIPSQGATVVVRPDMLTPTPPPSPISPITRNEVPHHLEYQQQQYRQQQHLSRQQLETSTLCSSNFSFAQHRTEYNGCASPDSVTGNYRQEEFSDVYHSASRCARKIKSEHGSRSPWRPW